MNEIDMDLHDEESSFDTDFENLLGDDENEIKEEKELVFYRRLEDY